MELKELLSNFDQRTKSTEIESQKKNRKNFNFFRLGSVLDLEIEMFMISFVSTTQTTTQQKCLLELKLKFHSFKFFGFL